MTWSYTRIDAYNPCKYRWFLKYIKKYKDNDMFYSDYGKFVHKIIEKYYTGELRKDELWVEFLTGFKTNVKGERPSEKIAKKYINAGLEYFKNFEPFPFNMVAVEKEINFEIDGKHFVGYIDFLGEKDGDYYIVDNKSRDLKPYSKRSKPTKYDKELDDMLRQLYLYAEGVFQEYGKYPKQLCFNCFKNGEFIRVDFDINVLKYVKNWATEQIEIIENSDDFEPEENFFLCNYLCGVSGHCINYLENQENRRYR